MNANLWLDDEEDSAVVLAEEALVVDEDAEISTDISFVEIKSNFDKDRVYNLDCFIWIFK